MAPGHAGAGHAGDSGRSGDRAHVPRSLSGSYRSGARRRCARRVCGAVPARGGSDGTRSATTLSRGHPRKKRSDVFSECRAVRATASARMPGDSRESNRELDSCVGEDTHLGEERVCDIDVAEVDGGENLGALEGNEKTSVDLCSRVPPAYARVGRRSPRYEPKGGRSYAHGSSIRGRRTSEGT